MRTNSISSVAICPVNFKYFNEINEITRDLDSSLLFAKLKFHQVNSKLKKGGRTWVVRSREQMADWFGCGIKKIDRLLASLESQGLIKKQVSLWYGKRRTFLSVSDKVETIPLNMQILETLTEIAGSIRAALVFSRVAFAFANTKIANEGKKWCCLKREELAQWSGLGLGTIDSILDSLVSNGLLDKQLFSWNGRAQSHFHIPDGIIEMIKNCSIRKREEKKSQLGVANKCTASSQNWRSQPLKKGLSIKIRTKKKEASNNRGDINFDQIGDRLSDRQDSYLRKALDQAIERKRIRVSNPIELLHQIRFSITNPQQHKGISSFKHALSRCLKILGDGNWRTPIGFNNHSAMGRKIKDQQLEREENWAKIKERECRREPKPSQEGRYAHQINLISGSLKQGRQDELTKQALNLATEMKRVAQNVSSGGQGVVVMVESLSSRIQTLIREGADRCAIMNHLNEI